MTSETYHVALHRMQSATALDLTRSWSGVFTEEQIRALKHLRVGLNSAMASQEGLVRLLIEKGLFDEAEYVEALREAMVREADRVVAEVLKRWNLPSNVSFA